MAQLISSEVRQGVASLRHYKFQRSVTLEANIDSAKTNVVEVNNQIQKNWDKRHRDHPNVELDFSGELDDIEESINALFVLALFGLGLIFLILGTQFNSFGQPFMIFITIPMAFTGVILGLMITQTVLSLFTIYGVVALMGISVNSAIMLISTANTWHRQGVSRVHATVFAARRRIIPILITSLTTIAGLFSLATGIAGYSLMWAPVATAMVWGLGFSTILTLFVIPLLYSHFSGKEAGDEDIVYFCRNSVCHRFLRAIRKARGRAGLQLAPDWEAVDIILENGANLLKQGEHWEALLHFEAAAKRYPANKDINLSAAWAFLLYMKRMGTDEGFLDRTQRYLQRVVEISPRNRKYRELLTLYQQLRQQAETEKDGE